jgi:hypothetical protein
MFAELKKQGLPVEFYPEFARDHIRTLRLDAHVQGEQPKPVTLDDHDQMCILRGQWTAERNIMEHSGEDIVLVTDGSTLNAHFYHSNPEKVIDPVKCVNQYDLLFFSRNINSREGVDGNRVHDHEFSKTVDARIAEFLQESGPYYHVHHLSGSVESRVSQALMYFRRHLSENEIPF